MQTCKTCRHWKEPTEHYARDICTPLDQDVMEPMAIGFRVAQCKNPAIAYFETPPEANGISLVDGSEYFAALCTGEDFGCVRHEPIPGGGS